VCALPVELAAANAMLDVHYGMIASGNQIMEERF
jgi:hypothetical protein